MSFRKAQPYHKSVKHFSKHAAPHRKNGIGSTQRGGIRL